MAMKKEKIVQIAKEGTALLLANTMIYFLIRWVLFR